MKLLIITNSINGLHSFRKELVEAFLKENEVFICAPHGEQESCFIIMGCGFIPCMFLRRRGINLVQDMKLIRFYSSIIKHIKPDIVLTYTIKPNVYGGLLCRRKGIPYIANVTGLGTSIENGGPLAMLTKSMYKIGLKKTCCVFFQNDSNRQFFTTEGIVQEHTRLLPGSGVNLDRHCQEPYPQDDSMVRFLFVGRMMRDKGIGELLQAIDQLHQEKSNCILNIVGSFEEDYSDIVNRLEKAGFVHYYGPKSDVHPFYKNCHCVVLPSYHEGMSNVLLEASATGRPVIATRVPGCRETFDEDITGLGCEAQDTGSLFQAMKKFMSLSMIEREKMGLAARAKMEREFDRNIVIRAYLDEIQTIIEEGQQK